jgi:hypothetical protein
MTDNPSSLNIRLYSASDACDEVGDGDWLEDDEADDLDLHEDTAPREPAAPIAFEGQEFARDDVPDDWYGCLSEWDMIAHLKGALRARRHDAAAAMALELMGFPCTWADVAREAADYLQRYREPWPRDAELARLAQRSAPGVVLPARATIWDCYTAIVRASAARKQSGAALLGALERTPG